MSKVSKEEIIKYAQAYYDGDPLISDIEFDNLYKEYLSENGEPFDIAFGYKPVGDKTKHLITPVGSLDKINIETFEKEFNENDLIDITPMFEEVDRQEMMKEEIKKLHLKNISVVIHYGLTANLARSLKAISIIRGLRLTTDYESELDISFNNRILSNGVPFFAQYTNPERIASERLDCGYAILPQPDPNGLFMPSSSSATWLLMIDPKSDKPRPVYIEQEITVSPFELVYGIEK